MPLLPLIGHKALRARLDEQVQRGTLASSLLFTGPAGIGKQRLALWLANRLLCEEPNSPCGACQHCRLIETGNHPDALWVFPLPGMKGKGNDVDTDESMENTAQGVAERLADGGLYERPDGSAGIHLHTGKMIVKRAHLSPALARRKVVIVGEADRMVAQAGSDQAANSILKLLEEPLADTTVVLTSSEPGALLPTIRSRIVSVRVQRLSDTDVREFLALPGAARLSKDHPVDELVQLAHGAPGALLDADAKAAAIKRARTLLTAARDEHDRMYRVAYAQGSVGARGGFSDTLDALTELLRDHSRDAANSGDAHAAAAGARAVVMVERAKRDAERNAVPQLVAFRLLSQLAETLA